MGRNFYIDKINKTVNFTFDFDKDIIKRIKGTDYNHRWNPELKEWIVPVNDWSKPNILSLIKYFGFKQLKTLEEEDVKIVYTPTPINEAYLRGLCDSKDFSYKPRDYQLEALGYALDKGNIINGDDVGLGKTFESIMYAETTNSFPCLVVVPASVKYNWDEKWLEITKNKRNVAVIDGKGTKKRPNNWKAEVVIINYDIIGKKQGRGATVKYPELLETEFKMVIFDEAHFLKNGSSQRTKAAKKIVTKIKKQDGLVQLLTGTVTMNKPVELWTLLDFIDGQDTIADDWTQFIYRYCGGYKGKFGWVTDGATNILELNKKMRENFYIRREKRDVFKEMPEVTKQIINVSITNGKIIDEALEDVIGFIRRTKGDEKAEKAMAAIDLVALSVQRQLSIEGKLKAIEQYLKDWKEGGKKLLVFGLHKEPLKYLAEKFKCNIIEGNSLQKLQHVKRWQKDDNIFLFGNMQSAGTGVDGLQNVCSNMLIMELPWRPSDLTQAIGRLDRSGQEEAVTVTFILSDETFDTEMWSMLGGKEQVTEAVNKGIDVGKTSMNLKAIYKSVQKRLKKV